MEITDILTIVVAILIFAIIILLFIYWNMSRKEKTEKTNEKGGNEGEENSSSNTYYSKLSVFDFMKFDTIEDNMIVQNNGERYAMVIECEGINYDLMSEIEKTSVEQGFIEFLNTLRHPIQLYIQTRTINISNSIEKYNQKLDQTKQELLAKRNEYNKMLQSNNADSKILNSLKMEIARLQNLFDYGTDIISNTEKMSLNKNVLRKHYYIVLSYYTAELGTNITDEEEKKNMTVDALLEKFKTGAGKALDNDRILLSE